MLFELSSLLLLSVIMAHMIPATLIRRLRGMELPPPEKPNASPAAADDDGQDAYKPTPIDIVVTRIMLTRSKRLPLDLVDSVFDFAEYWAHSASVIHYPSEQHGHLHIRGGSPQENSFMVSCLGMQVEYDPTDLTPAAPLTTSWPDDHPRRREPGRGVGLRQHRSETAALA